MPSPPAFFIDPVGVEENMAGRGVQVWVQNSLFPPQKLLQPCGERPRSSPWPGEWMLGHGATAVKNSRQGTAFLPRHLSLLQGAGGEPRSPAQQGWGRSLHILCHLLRACQGIHILSPFGSDRQSLSIKQSASMNCRLIH